MIGDALRLSLLVTVTATVVAGLFGLLLGRLLARQQFAGKTLLETAVLLPLVLPPSVIGYYLLIGMGNRSVLSWAGVDVLFTWPAAAIASAVVGLPLMVQASKAAIAGVNPTLENAARVMGAGEIEVFFRITLPLARRGILAGVLLAGARAFGEFGATLMVAGSIPGRTQTVPLAIYDAVQAGRTADANALVLLTTVLAFTSLLVVRLLEKQPERRDARSPRGETGGPA